VPAAAFTAAPPAGNAASAVAAAVVYAIGSAVCHQLPARSFWLWGRPLPVCARCAGIYVGAAAAALVWVARLTPSRSICRGRRTRLTCAAIAAVPTAATLLFEWTTGIVPSNAVRAAAGVILGATLSALVLAAGEAASDEVN
jgi:uncharacterized membrane protein